MLTNTVICNILNWNKIGIKYKNIYFWNGTYIFITYLVMEQGRILFKLLYINIFYILLINYNVLTTYKYAKKPCEGFY